jgi:hypothetical protein
MTSFYGCLIINDGGQTARYAGRYAGLGWIVSKDHPWSRQLSESCCWKLGIGCLIHIHESHTPG